MSIYKINNEKNIKMFGRLKFDVYGDVNLFAAIKVLDWYSFVLPNSYSRENKVFITRIYLFSALYIYIYI